MLQTRSSYQIVVVANTVAGGNAVTITNSSNLFITNTNLSVVAIQSGVWTVNVANTSAAASNVSIQNSAGWIVAVSNTGGSVVVSNTQTAINIINSAGWVMAQSNTSPLVQVQNSAGWVIAQSNTVNNINVINSAGWVIAAIDSSPIGSVVSVVASTVGTVTLASANTRRVDLAIYNASNNPLFMRLGASATTASYTLMMVASGYYELPRPVYNGIITGIWQSANGSAYITENT